MTTTEAPLRPGGRTHAGRASRRARRIAGPAWLDGPMTSCHLVLGAAGLLLAIGLVMVFSASAIEAALDDQPAWAPGVQQLVWACIGRRARCCVALRLPVGPDPPVVADRAAGVVGMLLLVLVPGVGSEAQRRPAVVRPRVRQLPALGGRQARLRAVGRARARPARALPDHQVAAGPGAAGVRGALAAADRRARLRGRGEPGPGARRPAVGRGHAAEAGSAGRAVAVAAVAGARRRAVAGPDGRASPRSSTRSPTPPTAASRRSGACTRWPPAGSGAWGWATAR